MSEQPGPVPALTDRELEITRMVAEGQKDRQIAAALVVSVRTVHAHLNHVYAKTGHRTRTALSVAYLSGRVAGEGEHLMSTTAPAEPPPKVRITVDLTLELHRALARWTIDSAEALKVPSITAADAVRAMIDATIRTEYETIDFRPSVSEIVRSVLVRRRGYGS